MPEMNEKYICLIDAYSSGAKLARYLDENYDVRILHIQSSVEILPIYKASFERALFESNFIFTGDFSELNRWLKAYPITEVIAGAESGVMLADEIAAHLRLQGNPVKSSEQRRNKYLMGEALRRAGLPHAHQLKMNARNDLDEQIAMIKKWPVVVKPLNSAGSDGVSICHNGTELKTKAALLFGQVNKLGSVNDELLVQERLFGQQYIVNTISERGRHFITEVWKDDRIEVEGAGLIYDKELNMDIDDASLKDINHYTFQVLDALEITHGPSHVELMCTEEGPRLIEVSARLQGGISHKAVSTAIGESHISITALLLGSRLKLHKYLSTRSRTAELMAVSLISKSDGVIVSSHIEDTACKLDSFYEFVSCPMVGDTLYKTIDLFTCPGVLYLLHQDSSVLQRDYQKIREWERQGKLFTTA
ncbi:ATP-grasp domain-containing protein [Pseudomonas sp. S2_H01]